MKPSPFFQEDCSSRGLKSLKLLKATQTENEKRSEEIAQLEDKVRQLEEQLHSQSAQAAEKVRRLEEQLRSQSAQVGGESSPT